MSAAQFMRSVHATRPENFGYPADCHVSVDQDADIQIHTIYYGAAPGVLFANAPNGSILYDNVNGNVYQKRGVLGLKDGTWKYQAINT